MKPKFILLLCLIFSYCKNSKDVAYVPSNVEYEDYCFKSLLQTSHFVMLPDNLGGDRFWGYVLFSYSIDEQGQVIEPKILSLSLLQGSDSVLNYLQGYDDTTKYPESILPFYHYFAGYFDSLKITRVPEIEYKKQIYDLDIFINKAEAERNRD